MDQKELLITKLIENVPPEHRAVIERAITFADERHGTQTRLGGEPHFYHVLRVALAVAHYAKARSLPIDILTVSALLHDVVEDTSTTKEEVAKRFGEEVARVVSAVSHEDEEESDEVYLKRVAEGGPLAILVKRFDRLDNLASLVNAPQEFRSKKIEEVRRALSIWRKMDSEGAALIEKAIAQLQENVIVRIMSNMGEMS